MSRGSVERELFNHYRDCLFKELGRKALDDLTINKIGKREFGRAWGGAHPQDRVKLKPHKYFIVNTDTHDKPGQHWTACYTTATRAYIYDSYGRPVKPLVSRLITTIHNKGYRLGKTDLVHHQEQIGYSSQDCGHLSLAWLFVVRDLGIARARKI